MKKITICVVSLLIIYCLLPLTASADAVTINSSGDYYLSSYHNGDTITISGGCVVNLIGDSETPYTDFQIVCGTGVTLSLQDVNIDDSGNNGVCPLTFSGSGNTLTLSGSNVLKGGEGKPAVCVDESTSLSIGKSTGTLDATGGSGGAGIGGGDGSGAGTIAVNDGTVIATGGSNAAGIGGGNGGGAGVLTFAGTPVIWAEGGTGAPYDIGGGVGGTGGSLQINSGNPAVFLRNDNIFTTIGIGASYKHYAYTDYTSNDLYGIPVPWTGDFGSYLILNTLAYDANGGNGTVPDTVYGQTGLSVSSIVKNADSLQRVGYRFTGWNTAPEASGTSYKPGDEFSLSDATNNTVLYAQWSPITYTVRYDGNGGQGTMDDSTFTYDAFSALAGNAYTKEHYLFYGWSTALNGDRAYDDKENVKNLADTQDAIVTLYAVWVRNTTTGNGMFTQYLPVPTDSPTWDFATVWGIATDTYGNVYVADYKNRIVKLNSNGEEITEWGAKGDGDGEFDSIAGVAFDSVGNVYVADNIVLPSDQYLCRVQVFTPDGAFIRKWTFSVKDNQYCKSIAIDEKDNVYVTDRYGLVKFSENGSLLETWTGLFANCVAADKKNGYIYVTGGYDGGFYENYLFRFSEDGKLLKTSSFGSKISLAYGLAVDSSGNVYVSEPGSDRGYIWKYNSKGKVVGKWKPVGNPTMAGVYALAADNYGNVYAGEDISVFKFSSNGKYLARWLNKTNSSGMFSYVSDIAFDNQGNLYVADRNNGRIQKFDINGTFVTKWSTKRPGDNDSIPLGIAVNSKGTVYVITMDHKRIDMYDGSGNFISSLNLGSGYAFDTTAKLAFDSDDNLYFNMDGEIQIYTKDLQFVQALGSCTDVPDFDPRCVAVGPDGYLYIADRNDRVIVYDKQGKFIRKWNINGGKWMFPEGIDCDADGNVYVAETYLNKIFEYDNQGNLLAQWGSGGSGTNQFSDPMSVKVGPDGSVYVADENNSRIMIKPVNNPMSPIINGVSLNTSPLLGFSPGGINTLTVKAGVTSEGSTDLKVYIYNSKGKSVAMLETTLNGSGNYTFTWDGKATANNEAGIVAGKIVPVSSAGTKYTLKLYAENDQGSVWGAKQTLILYSKPGVKWGGFSKAYVKTGTNAVFTYLVTRFSNAVVSIVDAHGNVVAVFGYSNVLPNKSITVTWNGKATDGNTLGLSAGDSVSPGKYYIRITAGSSVYKVKPYINVY